MMDQNPTQQKIAIALLDIRILSFLYMVKLNLNQSVKKHAHTIILTAHLLTGGATVPGMTFIL